MAARRRRARARSFLLAVASLFLLSLAEAHPARTSAVLLDLGSRSVEAELQLPLDELGAALGRPLSTSPATLVADVGDELRPYVASHLGATSRDGRAFAIDVGAMTTEAVDGGPALVVRVTLRPPPGAPVSAFSFHDDVILERVVTHKIFVSVRRDFQSGKVDGEAELVDMLHFQHDTTTVDRADGRWWRGFASVFGLGMRHIAEGTDHLLFLLVLLLPAPLLVAGRRWGAAAPLGQGIRQIVKIVTGFTVGHSLTLLVAATGLLHAPARPVETLIAVSILVSAVHAVRPVFRGREPLVAAGFGLVHGMAFAAVLRDYGIDAWSLATAVLGFNLGIEAMQLAVVIVVMPWFVILARTPVYGAVRVAIACAAALAACAWGLERALGCDNPLRPWVDAAFAHGIYLVGVLALAALASLAARRGRLPPRGQSPAAVGRRGIARDVRSHP